MERTRGDLTNFSSKAQITIFMILGLIILVVFLFLLQLSTRLNQEKLDISREKVFDAAFKKEGLRLYVDDCLQDELEKGLLLLGRQGRLWADQPGGRLHFEPGRSGIVYAPGEVLGDIDSSRVAYGLTKKDYIEQENAYPCLDEGHGPEFCQYRFPNTTLGFGTLELLPSTLKSDLQRFMANRTVWCVQQFVANNISRQAVLESEPAEVSVDILDDGIVALRVVCQRGAHDDPDGRPVVCRHEFANGRRSGDTLIVLFELSVKAWRHACFQYGPARAVVHIHQALLHAQLRMAHHVLDLVLEVIDAHQFVKRIAHDGKGVGCRDLLLCCKRQVCCANAHCLLVMGRDCVQCLEIEHGFLLSCLRI